MILTVDLSNTRISLSGVKQGQPLFSCSMTTSKNRTPDEYAALLGLILDRHRPEKEVWQGCILSSVVPELTLTVRQALQQVTGKQPLLVGPGVKTGLNICLDDPSQLGSDFVAAGVAAQAYYPLPAITVDLETAVSMGVLDGSGQYIGGVIAPGVMVSTAALTSKASLLHDVVPQAPAHIICRNTDESLRSGIIYGAAAMLDGLLSGMEAELGRKATVVATGAWAQAVVPYCRRKDIQVDPDLITRGLWLIWEKNQRKN